MGKLGKEKTLKGIPSKLHRKLLHFLKVRLYHLACIQYNSHPTKVENRSLLGTPNPALCGISAGFVCCCKDVPQRSSNGQECKPLGIGHLLPERSGALRINCLTETMSTSGRKNVV